MYVNTDLTVRKTQPVGIFILVSKMGFTFLYTRIKKQIYEKVCAGKDFHPIYHGYAKPLFSLLKGMETPIKLYMNPCIQGLKSIFILLNVDNRWLCKQYYI